MWPAGAHGLRRAAGLLERRLVPRFMDARVVSTSASSEQMPDQAPTQPLRQADFSTRKKHLEYLERLANINQLQELLNNHEVRMAMGIPVGDLARLMHDPNMHGTQGLERVKKLIDYGSSSTQIASEEQAAPERAVSAHQQRSPQSAPATKTSVPGSGLRQQQTTVAQHTAAAQPQKAYAAPSNGDGPPRPINRAGGQLSGPSQAGATGLNRIPAPATASEQGAHVGATPPAGGGAQVLNGASADGAASKRVSIRDVLNQQRIFLPSYAPGTYRALCPRCKGGSAGEQSFSITVDEQSKSAIWNCFRSTCGYSGNAHVDKPARVNDEGYFVTTAARKRKEEPPVRPIVKLEPLTPEMLEFFAARGISAETLRRNGVASELVYDPGLKKQARVIAFPYYRDGVLINVKYRTLDKRFWQARGAEKVLYGLDDIANAAEVIIVEGEMDKLALEEAGMKNVVSVPDGAPARVRDGDLPPASEDTKYSYLWNCRAWLDQAVRVVIATDNDAPGDALAEELARRLGRERCWRVRWPLSLQDHQYAAGAAQVELNIPEATVVEAEGAGAAGEGDTVPKESSLDAGASGEGSTDLQPATLSVDSLWYRKDANEVLLRDGVSLLRGFVETADPLPIRGLLRFHEYYDDIVKLYYLELRDAQGASTGWPALDKYYKVVPGELTIVTGVPNSGKSEWIDALLCNLSEMHGWTFAMCSMEKRATDHARQLAEKYVGRPFFDLPYGKGMKRMTYEQLDSALDWVDDRFHLIRYEDEQLPSVDWVLEIAKAAVYRYGIRGLVIDPYNELDHQRPASMNETEYVSLMLTKVKRFAQTAGVHVWFVAHPRQLREWRGNAPNLYDISGSAHFINKADNGIVVHRSRDPNAPSAAQVQILVRKVRNKAAGTIGDCVLEYDRVNGRYLDLEDTRAPKTSQQMPWAMEARQQAASAAASIEQQAMQGGMYLHPDGTVSSDPPHMD